MLCAGDPDSDRAFSGSARHLVQALDRRGILYHKANVLGWADPFAGGTLPVRLMRRLDRFGWQRRYQWSPACFAANTRRAVRIARAHSGFNACLMYGTTFCPMLDVPTYCYFDATVAQVRGAGAWEFAEMGDKPADFAQAYQQRVFENCRAIFPRTRWAGRSVTVDYGVPEDRVVPAGAGPNLLAEPLPHARYDGQTILFIGSEFERKGGPLLLEAFTRVRARLPAARLIIAGCAPETAGPGVEVLGRVDKRAPGGLQRLLTLYSEASVFCIMSHFEPFGIVVLEAQNSYVPCVAPARFAFPETVRDGETGRLVPEYDAALLARTLLDLLTAPRQLEMMGRAGHDFVRREWTWDAAAARIHQRILRDLNGPGVEGD